MAYISVKIFEESYVLRQLEAPYLARESCHSKLAQFSTIVFDETKICAGDLTKGTLDSCYVRKKLLADLSGKFILDALG